MNEEGNGPTQIIWLNVIAVRENDEDDGPKATFYGLTHVDNIAITPENTTILNTTTTYELVIPIVSRYNMSRLKFSFIPTASSEDNYLIELHKYCSLPVNVEWNLLKGFENSNTYALHLLNIPSLENNHVQSMNLPSITFTFPILDTLDDRMELEELALTRHHCTLVPCSEFIICPATFEEPVAELNLHKHCTNRTCVRFFEKITTEGP
jgi:hypothetical protein